MVKQLDCGLTVVIEPMASVRSTGVQWRFPAGSARDAAEREGESAMLEEYLFRGAGGMTSREHSDALDRVGVTRSSHVGPHHLSLSATMLGSRLAEALRLLAAVATDLALPDEAIEAVRQLCLQSIEGLADDPQHLVMLRLREAHLPPPFNRTGYGNTDHIGAMTIDQLRDAWRERGVPAGTLLGIAGAVEPDATINAIEELVTNWSGDAGEISEIAAPPRGIVQIEEATAQTHIGIAFDAPREADPDSMLDRLAVAVLSGGMSGRLFTEVRERRSLCYSVHARYSAGRDRGLISVYAGTTPDRAQETLDVTMGELHRLRDGVDASEFRRATIGLKSRLVMQGESTSARAAAITDDQFRLGRPRSLDEIARAIDAITLDQLNAYLARREFGDFTVATIGPVALVPPVFAA